MDEIRASALSYYRELSATKENVTAEEVKNLLLGMASGGRLLLMYPNGELNRELKNIARICGITRRLTWHCGRHTYVTEITLSQGVPSENTNFGNFVTGTIYKKEVVGFLYVHNGHLIPI
ncbi:hypothetical protein FACS1894123_01830 [Bacteroidia bacterium]|nr:hypothetical protein FACS1894123_01830 [Bacteroidia bacterium]